MCYILHMFLYAIQRTNLTSKRCECCIISAQEYCEGFEERDRQAQEKERLLQEKRDLKKQRELEKTAEKGKRTNGLATKNPSHPVAAATVSDSESGTDVAEGLSNIVLSILG